MRTNPSASRWVDAVFFMLQDDPVKDILPPVQASIEFALHRICSMHLMEVQTCEGKYEKRVNELERYEKFTS